MRLLLAALCLQLTVMGVLIQPKPLHGSITEVFLGTPATRYLVAPAFDSSDTRLFASADIRSPFLPPIPHSDSLKPVRNAAFPFVDNATFAGLSVPAVGIFLLRQATPSDLLDTQSSEGRLGLGPQSAFAKAYNISLRPVTVEVGRDTVEAGSDLELIGAIPELAGNDGVERIVPLMAESTAWAVNASLRINGLSLLAGFEPVELDPSAIGVEFPPSALPRLRVVMQLVSRDVVVDGTGRLWLPCDSNGAFTLGLRMELTAASGVKLDLNRIFVADPPGPAKRHPATGARVCFADFKMVPTRSSWRINPLVATSPLTGSRAQNVCFDSSNKRMVIRFPPEAAVGIPVVSGLTVPRVPFFGDSSLIVHENRSAEIRFPAHYLDEQDVALYALHTARPTRLPSGHLIYLFLPLGHIMTAPPVEFPGVFKMTGTGELRVNPDQSVSLPLQKVDESARGNKFRISIEQNPLGISLIATPLTAAGTGGSSQAFPPGLQEMFRGIMSQGPYS